MEKNDTKVLFDDFIDYIENKERGYATRAKVNALVHFRNNKAATKDDVEKIKTPYFSSESKLNAALPNATEGSKAWVGAGYPGTVWIVENGKWKDTGSIPPAEEVNIEEYAKRKDRAIGDLISLGVFTSGSTFDNIAADAIIDIEAMTDWSGQYLDDLRFWFFNNGNDDNRHASVYVNRVDKDGKVVTGSEGIIAQYLAETTDKLTGIRTIEIKEINFSGVNLKATIDFDKLPFINAVLTSENTTLNSESLLSKFKKTPREIVLRSDTSGVLDSEIFLVDNVGNYSSNMAIVGFDDLTWNNGFGYTSTGLYANPAMSYSDPYPVMPGSLIGVPQIPSATFCHVFVDKDDKVIQSFGSDGTTWEVSSLKQIRVPSQEARIRFTWGTAEQYTKHFFAELPKEVEYPVMKWDDLEWILNKAWSTTSKQPVNSAGMAISKRMKVSSKWLDLTTIPSTSMGFACFDINGKMLGVIVAAPDTWGDKKRIRLYHDTVEISLCFLEAEKEKFSVQGSSGTDFSIQEKGLYLVQATGRTFAVSQLSRETLLDAQNYTDEKIANLEIGGYDYLINKPILFPFIYLRSDKDVFLHKTSMLSSHVNSSTFGITLTSNGDVRKVIDIQDPTALDYHSIDNIGAKFIVRQTIAPTKLVYKEVQVLKADVSKLAGKEISIMKMGDSLEEGPGNWIGTPLCMAIDALRTVGVALRPVGTLVRDLVNREGATERIKYEGRGGWRYATLIGWESKFAGLNQKIPEDQTKSEWVLKEDGNTMNEIKIYNPFLYPATQEDLSNYPEFCFHFVEGNTQLNKSYAEDQTLSTYHIFDPTRYFQLRNIEKPAILTIAFGTNEWYLNAYGGFNLSKAIKSFSFIVTRFRQALPNTNIVVVPAQTLMIGRDEAWRNQYSVLCSGIIKATEQKIAAGDNRIFIGPFFAQCSRFLAFDNPIGTAIDISEYNSTKEVSVSQDVHYMYNLDDEGNSDYTEALAACLLNMIE